jgi:hypothetical protein
VEVKLWFALPLACAVFTAMDDLPISVFLAPFFLLFELTQLVYAERYLGLKRLQSGVDPRTLGPSEAVSLAWATGIIAEGIWLLWLLQSASSRVHAVCLLLVSLFGYALRTNCAVRWVLVILTIEGALRMGLMVSLLSTIWRQL